MDCRKKWQMLLKSGNFRRKVKKYRNTVVIRPFQAANQPIQKDINSTINVPGPVFKFPEYIQDQSDISSNEESPTSQPEPSKNNYFEDVSMLSSDSESSSDESLNQSCIVPPMDFEKSEEEKKTGDLQTFLRSWGIEHNIRQHAMKPLLQRLNQLDSKIPTDPRRLLSTPRNKKPISSIEGGQYWHQGIGKMIKILVF